MQEKDKLALVFQPEMIPLNKGFFCRVLRIKLAQEVTLLTCTRDMTILYYGWTLAILTDSFYP
jgi:hypothetical protein